MLGGYISWVVLYDFCNVDWKFSEAGSAVFLHYPAWIWVVGSCHVRLGDSMSRRDGRCERLELR